MFSAKIIKMPVSVTIATPGPDEEICKYCNGRGVWSKYDHGWTSIIHSEELAALRKCSRCNGTGLIKKGDFNV